ncbi:hypothetical protein CEB3_c20690 [Peptococcaceae bacterium CEB3]|nr:hypothetical protein CEB3_c20690 [Peptococcaceae bacterium CEB3]
MADEKIFAIFFFLQVICRMGLCPFLNKQA